MNLRRNLRHEQAAVYLLPPLALMCLYSDLLLPYALDLLQLRLLASSFIKHLRAVALLAVVLHACKQLDC